MVLDLTAKSVFTSRAADVAAELEDKMPMAAIDKASSLIQAIVSFEDHGSGKELVDNIAGMIITLEALMYHYNHKFYDGGDDISKLFTLVDQRIEEILKPEEELI